LAEWITNEMLGNPSGILLENLLPTTFGGSSTTFSHSSPFRDTEAGLEGAPP
jgi:hypothetical protein